MKKIILLITTLFLICSVDGYSQKKSDNDYNLRRAYEVLQKDGDEKSAVELLNEQLKQTPKNSEALLLRARIRRKNGEYGSALQDINRAIECKGKKTDKELSNLYWWKATLYMDMGDIANAVDVYKRTLSIAQKYDKENVTGVMSAYAEACFRSHKLDEADNLYNKMLRINEADQGAMVGIARSHIERGEYESAISLLEKCKSYGSEYSEIYHYLSKAYSGLEENDKAIDAALMWLDKDDDAYDEHYTDILLMHKTYSIAKVKEFSRKSENPAIWRFVLAGIYEMTSEYVKAIAEYDYLEDEYGKDTWISSKRAECYSELGLTNMALKDIEFVIEKDDDANAYAMKGQILRLNGRYEEAIDAFDKVIDLTPSNAWGYYAKGWCYELSGNDEKALEHYNEGIDLDKSYPYIFLMRAELLDKLGRGDDAQKDYEMVLQIDTVVSNSSCRMYALHFLGRDDEAEEWMNNIIKANPYSSGNYYDKACLYSRMGRLDDAVEAFTQCVSMGYCSVAHIEHDDDLDPIRNRDDFKQALMVCRDKLKEHVAKYLEDEVAEEHTKVTEVRISKQPGGTFEIPCAVNGLELNMIFDTGASNVTISSVEANFMLKNGQLSSKDIKGKAHYLTASGDIHEGTVITIREVRVGDAVLKNIDASVVKNQRAPLLLGQSVLEKFGSITIDNVSNKLIIKH